MSKFKIERALISVFDKSYLLDLLKVLAENGVEILSSGGTANTIRDAGFKVTDVSDYTGSPEVFAGRVKTLHPKVHGGILLRRENPEDIAEAETYGIKPIDLVVVNLYPFMEKIREGADDKTAMELVDIGGVALLRAAAKNFPYVAVLNKTRQYGDFIKAYTSAEGITLEIRRRWAADAFTHTAIYDSAVAHYFTGDLFLHGSQGVDLRYGENPHQTARWYKSANAGLSRVRQLHGKEMSYINVLDIEAAVNIVGDFSQPACVIIKHTTPCGLAIGYSPKQAYERAYSCDTRSPFGGIVGFNTEVDKDTADILAELFLEAVAAPSFTDRALAVLQKKKNLRLIETAKFRLDKSERRIVSVSGGFLSQEGDYAEISKDDFKVMTKLTPTAEQWEALVFGAKAVKWAKSNAVVLNNRWQTLGIGCGQTSRVGSVEIAVANAARFGHSLQDAVMASDAFFPFPDSVEEAAKVGIKAVVQPGGSVKDEEVIKAADELGITMVFTGKRHFRH